MSCRWHARCSSAVLLSLPLAPAAQEWVAWAREAASAERAVWTLQTQVTRGEALRCSLPVPDAQWTTYSWLRNITAWYDEPWETRQALQTSLRSFIAAASSAASFAPCPALALQARLLDIELQLHRPTQVAPAGLLQQLAQFARVQLVLWRLERLVPQGPPDALPAWVPATTAPRSGDGLSTALLARGQLRVLAMLRTWAVYNSRHYELTTDNNCEGQWCFFEPCSGSCPDELCFDTRIDAMELTATHSNVALDHLLDPQSSWPWLRASKDARFVKLEGMSQFNIPVVSSILTDKGIEGEVQHYVCEKEPSRDLFSLVARAFLTTTFIGCIATRIALELICSAGDADEGRISDAISRLFSAAMMATLCADCTEGWQLPLRPGGLWYAAAAAQDLAAGRGLLLPARAAGPVDQRAARVWWREALAEARGPRAPVWDGPEVTVCPVELEDGVVLTCGGLEVGARSRFANAIAIPQRPFLRACRSALRYHAIPRPAPPDGCDERRTLVLLPHADLIGHLINGLQWFLPLVWSVHAELGGPANVVIAVVDSGWIDNQNNFKFNEVDYENRNNPRFFLPLLHLLSASPPLFLSDLERQGCARHCFRRAVWGYRQLSTHRERLRAGRPRPGAAVYQEALELWARASPVVNDAVMGMDHFYVGPGLRLGPNSYPNSKVPSAAVVRLLFIQRTKTRRLQNLPELIAAAEELPHLHGFAACAAVAGENGTAGWKAMSSLAQMGLARQTDIMIGPSGNELGLAAFMQRGRWLLELMPPPVYYQDGSLYEINNCLERWDANPGSLVGHTALRALVHHACLFVSVPGGGRVTMSDVSAPHWRHIPTLHVDMERFKQALIYPLMNMAKEHAWVYKAVDI